MHPDDADGLDARLQHLEAPGGSGLVDRRLLRLDGGVMDVELVAVPRRVLQRIECVATGLGRQCDCPHGVVLLGLRSFQRPRAPLAKDLAK